MTSPPVNVRGFRRHFLCEVEPEIQEFTEYDSFAAGRLCSSGRAVAALVEAVKE